MTGTWIIGSFSKLAFGLLWCFYCNLKHSVFIFLILNVINDVSFKLPRLSGLLYLQQTAMPLVLFLWPAKAFLRRRYVFLLELVYLGISWISSVLIAQVVVSFKLCILPHFVFFNDLFVFFINCSSLVESKSCYACETH